MQVNRDSWHYKWLAYSSVMGSYVAKKSDIDELRKERGKSYIEIYETPYLFKRPTNFCQYWRAVLITPIASVFINTLFLAALASVIFMFPMGAMYGAGIIAGGITVLIIIGLFVGGFEVVHDKMQSLKQDPTSFVGNAYNSYKNNVCTLMEYKDEEDK